MGKGGGIRYASTATMPASVRGAAERALKDQRSAAPAHPYRPGSVAAALPVKAQGRMRHRVGEMNATEQAYASHLDFRKRQGEVMWWEFEAIKLRLAKNTTLTVDFFVMVAGGALEAHEIKGGHWEDDARVKVKVAAEMYPFQFYGVQRDGSSWKFESF